jgi:Mg2+ and Co2+ transporter CorA
MGFLALAAVTAGVAPLLFHLSPATELACDAAGWVVVALFAVEYCAQLALAENRVRFALDPWRALDAAIILAALASLLPAVSGALRLGPALRLLRLGRVLLFGARVGYSLRQPVLPPVRPSPAGPPGVGVLRPGDAAPQRAEWSDLLRWAGAPTNDWLHASNLSPALLHEVAAAAGAPHAMIEAALHQSSYPRIEAGPRWTALTLPVPVADGSGQRDLVVMLVTESDVLSLSMHPLDLQQPPAGPAALPWGPRCVLATIRRVLERNEALAGRLEAAVRAVEDLPPETSPQSFFEQTFRLKRLLATAKGDLWRLLGLIEMIADGRRFLPGLTPESRAMLRELAGEAEYLHETVEDLRDAVMSIIDLHIDVAAHDMNRFMRVLAIVSVLALIPAIAGGLLGMNLADSPWAMTLGEVAFLTFVLMAGILYAFMAKGWLR